MRSVVKRLRLYIHQCIGVFVVQDGIIATLASDHSPSPCEDKVLQEGNFLKAWGGISGEAADFTHRQATPQYSHGHR